LKEATKMNNFLLHSSLIGVLGAEQSAPKDRRKFPENGDNLCGRREFDICKGFDKPCQYNRPACALRSTCTRGNIIYEDLNESSSARLGGSQQLEILPSLDSKKAQDFSA
jgi:hypothetical protein